MGGRPLGQLVVPNHDPRRRLDLGRREHGGSAVRPYPIIVLAGISGVLAPVAACQGPLILLAQRRGP